MKIKFNTCPICGGVVECKQISVYGLGKHFRGRCTKCGLNGEMARNKSNASEKWNNGDVLYDDYEIKNRLIKMCESEIKRFNTENQIDIKYVRELKDMIRYFNM